MDIICNYSLSGSPHPDPTPSIPCELRMLISWGRHSIPLLPGPRYSSLALPLPSAKAHNPTSTQPAISSISKAILNAVPPLVYFTPR